MIAFKQDTTINIVEEFDFKTDTVVKECDEVFKAGEFVDAEIVEEVDGKCELEFGDGSLAYNIPRDSFDVL